MRRRTDVARGAALALAALAGCGSTPPTPEQAAATTRDTDDLRYSNKWRIEVSEGANSDGEFVFHVTPRGGATQVITVTVDDGEDVLVNKDLTEPQFALEVISSTVQSVRLRLQKE
jgi:hypothetical protein